MSLQSLENKWKLMLPAHKKKEMWFPGGLNTKQAGPKV